MTGLVREDRRVVVDVDDETLDAISAGGGRVIVVDSDGGHTHAELFHDGERFALKLAAVLSAHAGRIVKIKLRAPAEMGVHS